MFPNVPKTGLRKVYKKSMEKVPVFEDQIKVIFSLSYFPGGKLIHALDHSEVDYDQQLNKITKFPKKCLVFQVTGEFGNISDGYI